MAEEIAVSRIINAPRELVWRVWTEPELLKRWWGPKQYTSSAYKMDARLGGEYFGAMRGPDGKDIWAKGVYKEVAKPERLVMTDSFADPEGNTVRASYYGMSGDGALEMLVTLTLEDEEGKTKLTIVHSGIEGMSEADMSNMRQGWNESLDKLDEFLTSLQGERSAA
jgi:uncharacterized protein YndB with AHSA1/START domain